MDHRVHLTETCDEKQPRLITQVETTTAAKHDSKVTQKIQDDLVDRDLKPDMQLVDEAYIEVDLLINSQRRSIDLVGPCRAVRVGKIGKRERLTIPSFRSTGRTE